MAIPNSPNTPQIINLRYSRIPFCVTGRHPLPQTKCEDWNLAQPFARQKPFVSKTKKRFDKAKKRFDKNTWLG
jgi:hypothetical protein